MEFRKKISILGFLIGSITDIVGTNIWALFMMIYVLMGYHLLQNVGTSSTELTNRLIGIFQTDPIISTLNFVVGALFSIIGGFISAWIAKHDELLNGALSSFLCVLSGLCGLFSASLQISRILLALLGLILSPLLGMFGGYLRLRLKNRKNKIDNA
jgi:hypothetical protein